LKNTKQLAYIAKQKNLETSLMPPHPSRMY
jgi:hypothetical protein